MESNELLRELDRAAARPFADYPPTPWWYPGLIGGNFAAIATALLFGADGNTVAEVVIFIGAVVCLLLFVGWYRSRWGTWPQMFEAPAEIRRAYRHCLAGMTVALVVAVVAGLLSPPVVTVVVTFVVFTAVIWGYERKVCPAACADVRARLA